MVKYRAQLNKYLDSRKVIGAAFFKDAANAQLVCEVASKSASTFTAQNHAQATFKAGIRTASEVHNAAIKALGPRPIMPIRG